MNPWIEALRLRSLPMSVAGAVVASGLAAATGAFRPEVFLLFLITVLSLQILANFADEYGDLQKGADTDERIGPKRAMQRGEISFSQMKCALIGMTVLTFVLGIILVLVSFGLDFVRIAVFLGLGCFALFAAIAYTVGKRAYGYHGLADIFCLVCFGLLAVCGGYYLYAHAITLASVAAGIGIGLLVTGMLNLNNMRDRETDEVTGKRTLAVQIGANAAKRYHNQLVVVGMLCILCSSFALMSSTDIYSTASTHEATRNTVSADNGASESATNVGSGTNGNAVNVDNGVGENVTYNDALTATANSLLGESNTVVAASVVETWQWWRLLYVVAFVPLVLHLRSVNRVLEPAGYDTMMRPYSLYVVALSILFAVCVGV